MKISEVSSDNDNTLRIQKRIPALSPVIIYDKPAWKTIISPLRRKKNFPFPFRIMHENFIKLVPLFRILSSIFSRKAASLILVSSEERCVKGVLENSTKNHVLPKLHLKGNYATRLCWMTKNAVSLPLIIQNRKPTRRIQNLYYNSYIKFTSRI